MESRGLEDKSKMISDRAAVAEANATDAIRASCHRAATCGRDADSCYWVTSMRRGTARTCKLEASVCKLDVSLCKLEGGTSKLIRQLANGKVPLASGRRELTNRNGQLAIA